MLRAALAPAPGEALDPKTANVLYHDAAARSYDAKWAISFDDRCIAYVGDRAARMLPGRRYGRVLEVGAGTGFFILNLWQAGYVDEPHATDISPGMVAASLENARRLGCDLRARTADAEALPFEDGSFDLVVGHAFLHHLPDPRAGLAEMRRVLAPGGSLLVAGEPTAVGDRIARRAGRLVSSAMRAADGTLGLADAVGRSARGPGDAATPRRLRRDPAPPASDSDRVLRDLESEVDLHTFEPAEVESWARAGGFANVRVETEELLASLFGWSVRTIEAEARSGLLGPRWAWFAYRTYLRLYEVDMRVLYPRLPKRWFYNLLLYGERAGG